MPLRVKRRLGPSEHAADEGPFVSFTDLFIGILFLFLILVAALMLMHQEAVQQAKLEEARLNEEIRRLQAELAALAQLDINHPPFRLAIVFNSYQRAPGKQEWVYSRTVQVYRAPNGLCLDNVIMRNNLNLAWKPPLKAEEIPNTASKIVSQMGVPCTLSASGEKWNSDSEFGGVRRVSPTVYSGSSTLHKGGGDVTVDMQYRILGIYDDYYR